MDHNMLGQVEVLRLIYVFNAGQGLFKKKKHFTYIIGVIYHSWNDLHSWINAPLFVGYLAMRAAGIQETAKVAEVVV